ncbi:hypothetical protein SLA2020_034710 [Shorea laevis]
MYQHPAWRRSKACTKNSPYEGPLRKDAPSWCHAPFEPEGILSSISSLLSTIIRAPFGHVLIYLKMCRVRKKCQRFLVCGLPCTVDEALLRPLEDGLNSLLSIEDLHALISPVPEGTPLPLVLLGKSKNALLSTFLFLNQIVWFDRTSIYKNKERAELLGWISLFCWMGSSICSSLVELGELGRLLVSMEKLEKELKNSDKCQVCLT